MTFEAAVKRMQKKTGPYFGVIVENTEECRLFLDKLEQYMPPRTVEKSGPLREYAFEDCGPVVAVTLSRWYANSYNRWSSFNSLEDMLSYAKQSADKVDWIMWYNVSDNDINFSDLL